jgi:hypothetical protein
MDMSIFTEKKTKFHSDFYVVERDKKIEYWIEKGIKHIDKIPQKLFRNYAERIFCIKIFHILSNK